ncbi:MAG: T9SS type A sorting domain-containing protein [Saprospiraceae bacterium]|nr:T9SS type A sorting domain-containing protein [Saprospiraceae bacterium]
MNRYFVLLFLLLSSAGLLTAQGWERTYGGGGQDVAKGLALTPDGGYIMAGYYGSTTRVYLIKTDADGDLQWTKTFPAVQASGNAVLVTRDSGYAVAGFIDQGSGNQRDIYLLKTDANGNPLWTKTFGNTKNDEGASILELADGSLVISGFQTDPTTNRERAFIARVSATGNNMWVKLLGSGAQLVKSNGVTIAPDGDLVLTGEIRQSISETKDIYVARLSAFNGAVIWENTYGLFDLGGGTAADDFGRSIVAAKNGGFVIAGFTNSILGGGGLLLKIDEAGGDAVIWYKTFPATDFRGLVTDKDNGFFVTGSRDVSALNGELYILHANADGDKICDATVGKGGPDIGFAIVATPDGGAAAAGSSQPGVTTFEENPYLAKVDKNCKVFTSYLKGNVFHDFNTNCSFDAGEAPLKGWLVKVASPDFVRYAAADENGNFLLLVDTGSYDLQLITPNSYWGACLDGVPVDVLEFYDTVSTDIPVYSEFSCPRNEIDIATPLLRNCENNVYTVRYCNTGTVPSLDTRINVVLDPNLTAVGSSISYTQDQDTLRFNIGTLNNGDCGSFTITAFLECDALVGLAHCMTAHITPDSFCDINPSWDKSIIEAIGRCENDTVKLSVRNSGTGTYSNPASLDYVIIEDVVMLVQPGTPEFESIQTLLPGETRELLNREADGKTYRVIAEQSAFYPGFSYPTAAVEGCITDTSQNPISIGFYTMFPNPDGEAFVATDCQESVEANYNPPSFFKRGHPKGYGVPQYVDPTTDLEFLIRFQNTGTDTVHQVIIRDTLSAWLDPTTVLPGTSSHPYDFDLYGNGIVQFTIPNLNLLPGSSGSEGYVKFRVSQQPNLPCGTQIFNTAAITFDFSAPVLTNQTFNTVCPDSLFLPVVATKEIDYPGADVKVYPNPFMQSATFEITGVVAKTFRLELYDAQGRLVFNQFYSHSTFQLFRPQLPPGAFYYRLAADGRPVASGKIINASGQ